MNQTFLTFLKKKVVSILISKIFTGSGRLQFAFLKTTTTTKSASRQAITLFEEGNTSLFPGTCSTKLSTAVVRFAFQ
jgi:hypothetical protein